MQIQHNQSFELKKAEKSKVTKSKIILLHCGQHKQEAIQIKCLDCKAPIIMKEMIILLNKSCPFNNNF